MSDPVSILYDGECPFCSRFVAMVRLREAVGPVELINARDGGPLVDQANALGLDLDEGMVLVMDGQFHHGAEAMNRIAMLSSDSTIFNKFNGFVFRNAGLSRALYPVLRGGRNATLALLGRRKMRDDPPPAG
ncbi:thiol-disulfide oxidoreductase DCC family protein [Aestuariibius insulae]|uniref:thiol-disulfide oxidoreductase DCC family protein n=1 Tax=Aestuariibius insulae TaxID=2058287 RepID=UPI00345EC656